MFPVVQSGEQVRFRARGLSLKVRLVMLVLAAVAPPIALLTLLSIHTTGRLLEDNLDGRGRLAVQVLDNWFATGDGATEPARVQAEVDRLVGAGHGITYTAIFLFRDGRLEAIAASGGRPLPFPRREETAAAREDLTIYQTAYRGDGDRDRFRDIAAPLHRGNEVSGAVNFELTRVEADQLLADLRRDFLLAAIGAIVLTAAGALLYVHRAIGRPTQDLVEAMERARAGDLAAEATVLRLDEFGWLAANFNRLLRRVRESDEDLQRKVKAATGELARKNVDLSSANEKLFELQRDAARLERLASLGQLASQIAHQVGTPLNAIYGHIQLLRQDPAVAERHGERLATIEGQIERLTLIIRGVLSDARAPEAKRERVDLGALLREIATFAGPAMAHRSVKLELAAPSEGLPPVLGDPRELSHVLMNLVTNALDAMPGGGRLKIDAARDGADVVIAVADAGVGIAPDVQKRIFEPFFSTKALGYGTGLGLSVAQEIVKKHGGTIAVRSAPGAGATFTVRLPADVPVSPSAPVSGSIPSPSPARVSVPVHAPVPAPVPESASVREPA